MSPLVPIALLVHVVVGSQQTWPVGPEPKSLYDVYGELAEVKTMLPRTKGYELKSDSRLYDQYKSTRDPRHCHFPLDVFIVQDATGSFEDNFMQMERVQLPLMMETLRRTHPGSKFGIMTFQDKPIQSFGSPSDYCQRFNVALTHDGDAVRKVYSQVIPNGGLDPPENQFGALLGATQALDAVGWGVATDRARLVVMVTDAPPHFQDERMDWQGMVPSNGIFDLANMDKQCTTEFYPPPEFVKDSIHKLGAYLATLVYDPDYMNGLPGRSWTWFNRFLGQKDEFITLTTEDSSDFWKRLSKVIEEVERLECGDDYSPTTTPTPVPSTTPPQTASPTPSTTSTADDEETVTPVGNTEAAPTADFTPTIDPTPIHTTVVERHPCATAAPPTLPYTEPPAVPPCASPPPCANPPPCACQCPCSNPCVSGCPRASPSPASCDLSKP